VGELEIYNVRKSVRCENLE